MRICKITTHGKAHRSCVPEPTGYRIISEWTIRKRYLRTYKLIAISEAQKISSESAVSLTESWIKDIVIDMGLCPFAYEVYSKDLILYAVTDFHSADNFISVFKTLLDKVLSERSPYQTAVLIIRSGLEEFQDYLEVYGSMTEWLEQKGQSEDIQLASFHPDYLFAETEENDPSNFTNRSPFPILHLLRTEDVTQAIDSHPDIHSVPDNNIQKMREMGITRLLELWQSKGF